MSALHSDLLINGAPATSVSAYERGLRYGDGVFETLAVIDHQPVLWGAHLERLRHGCARLGIPPPEQNQLAADLTALSLPSFGALRLTVTRGNGGQGYAPPATPQPTRILQRLSIPDRPAHWWHTGVAVRDCQITLASQPALAGVKHLNRLEQVLARGEWRDPDIAEGLMCSADGALVEATAANLLIDDGERLIIPDTSQCGVDGVMQTTLLRQAEVLGIPWERRVIYRESLRPEHGLMLSNSLIGLWSVATRAGTVHRQSTHARALQTWINEARLALTPEIMAT